MKCTYCGAEVAEHHRFCMSCGTEIRDAVEEPEEMLLEPAAEESEVQEDIPVFQEKRAVIDPSKFEFFPEKCDMPLPKGVSSWELVPADFMAPKLTLPTKRGLGRMVFLGLITLGIYPTVIYSRIVTELNILASRYDGRRTMPFFGMLMLAPLTLSVYPFVWFHNLCGRMGDELQRRGIDYKFGPSAFWLWNVLGAFILVGPFVFLHKLMKSMNLLNKSFNEKG